MAKYKSVVVTDLGLALVAAAHSGGTIKFTTLKTGSGVYDGTETLKSVSGLKSVRQSFGISGITREAAVVKVRSVVSNKGLTAGYYLTEIGLYALDPNTGKEILYAIVIAEDGMEDYLTHYSDSPQSMSFEMYIAAELEEEVMFTASIVEGTYATAQDFSSHTSNKTVHITAAERSKWNAKVDSTGAKFSGNIYVVTETAEERRLEVINSLHDGRCTVSKNGNFGLWDQTYGKWLIRSDLEGTIVYESGRVEGGGQLLHTGISRPVIVSATAPTDTTAIWIK